MRTGPLLWDFVSGVLSSGMERAPVFLLAVDQELVKQEENPLLYVSG